MNNCFTFYTGSGATKKYITTKWQALPSLSLIHIFKLCWCAAHVDRYSEKERYELLQYIDNRAIRGGNIKIEAYGLENIPKENGFMFFPNHQGLFDVLAILQVCPVPFSVVAKKELTDVPFLKQVFACMKALMIDREDIKQSMQVILQVIKEVKEGRNYLIFAEGTLSLIHIYILKIYDMI